MSGTVQSDHGPSYIEAYPRIDIRAARKHISRGRNLVLWRDEYDVVIGRARGWIRSEENIHLEYRFRSDESLEVQSQVFDLLPSKMANGSFDYFTTCFHCQSRRRVVIFVLGEWACATCHQLTNRSAAVGSAPRWTEEIIEIERKVGRGRPKGMHMATYERLIARRDWLEERLQGRRISPHIGFSQVITAAWVKDTTRDVLP